MPNSCHDAASAAHSSPFDTTQWSVVLLAGAGAPEALERLCRAYWPPLYAYARRDGLSPEDAEDAVQEFILILLRRGNLRTVAPELGRFRSFLLRAFINTLVTRARAAAAQKRGGGHAPLRMDDLTAEQLCRPELVDGLTPERAFDRAWARTVMARALECLGREQSTPQQRAVMGAVQPALSGSGRMENAAELAAGLGMSPGALATAATRLRQRYRTLIEHEVTATLSSPDQLADEMQTLRAVWT